MTTGVSTEQSDIDRKFLYKKIHTAFDTQELIDFCFNLSGSDSLYEDLPGPGRIDKARNLVGYYQRRNQLVKLVEACKKARPEINWNESLQIELNQSNKRQRNVTWAFVISSLVALVAITVLFISLFWNSTVPTPANVQQRFDFAEGIAEWQLLTCLTWNTPDCEWTPEQNLLQAGEEGFTDNQSLQVNATLIQDTEQTYSIQYKFDGTTLAGVNAQVFVPSSEVDSQKPAANRIYLRVRPKNSELPEDEWPKSYLVINRPGWHHITLNLEQIFDDNGESFSKLPVDAIHIDLRLSPSLSSQNENAVFYVDDVEFFRSLSVQGKPSEIDQSLNFASLKTNNVAIYSFEECGDNGVDETQDWEVKIGENKTLACSSKYAFQGHNALEWHLNIQKLDPEFQTWGKATGELRLRDRINSDQLFIVRVYLPEEAPDNIRAILAMIEGADTSEHWHEGYSYNLVPGEWTTLAWSTKNVGLWKSPAQLGLHVQIHPDADSDEPYSGPLYVDMIEIYKLPDYFTAPSQGSGEDVFVYSFEDGEIDSEWITDGKIYPSGDYAFDGRYSAALEVTLTERNNEPPYGNYEDTCIKIASNQIQQDFRVEDNFFVFRVFVPEDAPENLYGQFYLEGKYRYKTYRLESGKWNTLTWYPAYVDEPWERAEDEEVNLGICFFLEGRNPRIYNNYGITDTKKLYVDMVEIIPLPVPRESLDKVLSNVEFYKFTISSYPEEFLPPNPITYTKGITNDNRIPGESDGHAVLEIAVNLPPYSGGSIEASSASVGIPLDGQVAIDAVTTAIYIPDEINGERVWGDFEATIIGYLDAGDGSQETYYSISYPITLGEWNNIFWGTRYAQHGDGLSNLTDPKFNKLSIHITSSEHYEGSVYIDYLGLYTND